MEPWGWCDVPRGKVGAPYSFSAQKSKSPTADEGVCRTAGEMEEGGRRRQLKKWERCLGVGPAFSARAAAADGQRSRQGPKFVPIWRRDRTFPGCPERPTKVPTKQLAGRVPANPRNIAPGLKWPPAAAPPSAAEWGRASAASRGGSAEVRPTVQGGADQLGHIMAAIPGAGPWSGSGGSSRSWPSVAVRLPPEISSSP